MKKKKKGNGRSEHVVVLVQHSVSLPNAVVHPHRFLDRVRQRGRCGDGQLLKGWCRVCGFQSWCIEMTANINTEKKSL
jgi:hypothetical protein